MLRTAGLFGSMLALLAPGTSAAEDIVYVPLTTRVDVAGSRARIRSPDAPQASTSTYRLAEVFPPLEQPWYGLSGFPLSSQFSSPTPDDSAEDLLQVYSIFDVNPITGALLSCTLLRQSLRGSGFVVRSLNANYPDLCRYASDGSYWISETGYTPEGIEQATLQSGVVNCFPDMDRGPDGDVFVLAAFGCTVAPSSVFRFDGTTGAFEGTVGTRGAGADQYSNPGRLAVAANGDVVVAEFNSNTLVQFDASGVFVRKAPINCTGGCLRVIEASANGELYTQGFSSTTTELRIPVRFLDATLSVAREVPVTLRDPQIDAAGYREARLALAIEPPQVKAVGPNGEIYVADELYRVVRVFDPTGNPINVIGPHDNPHVQPDIVTGVAPGPGTDLLVYDRSYLGPPGGPYGRKIYRRLRRYESDGAIAAKYAFSVEPFVIDGFAGDAQGRVAAVVRNGATLASARPSLVTFDVDGTRRSEVVLNASASTGAVVLAPTTGSGALLLVDESQAAGGTLRLADLALNANGSLAAAPAFANVAVASGILPVFVDRPSPDSIRVAHADGTSVRVRAFDRVGGVWTAGAVVTIANEIVSARVLNGLAVSPNGDIAISLQCGGSGSCAGFSLPPSIVRVFSSDGASLLQQFRIGTSPGTVLPVSEREARRRIAYDATGHLLIAEEMQARVSRFERVAVPADARAVIVAGGGPFAGNALWDATETSAGLAFRALAFQGFGQDTIQVLSPSTDNDLDGNGFFDDVDATATVANLDAAITGAFAAATSELFVYLVDHGGDGVFRMSETEYLRAAQLDAALDAWQAAHPAGRVVVVIDACESGSFIPVLAGPQRVIVTSASAGQNAYFLYRGALSFSASLFTQVIGGVDVATAFGNASQVIQEAFANSGGPFQSPRLEADGDGVANEPEDLSIAQGYVVGTGLQNDVQRPQVGSVAAPASVLGEVSVTVQASGVASPSGIRRVWMVLQPPGLELPDVKPVADLPTVELVRTADGEYSITHDGFTRVGTWLISVFAQDAEGRVSRAVQRTLLVQSPRTRKAVVAVLGSGNERRRSAYVRAGAAAENALRQQGYGPDGVTCQVGGCDATFVVRNGGVADASSTLANLDGALTTFAADTAQDVIVYLVGQRDAAGLRVNASESVTPAQLDAWLDTLQQSLPGVVTVIVDADDAATFVAASTPPVGKRRVTVSSTSAGQRAVFTGNGAQSFGTVFWSQVANGATYLQAHNTARDVIRFASGAPFSRIDDNGNGIANEPIDGALARRLRAGNGLLLAGDAPYAASIVAPALLNGSDVATVTVTGVDGTAGVSAVRALLSTPTGFLVEADLAQTGPTTWSADLPCFGGAVGAHELLVHAIDGNDALSAPLTATVVQNQLAASPCLAVSGLFSDGFE